MGRYQDKMDEESLKISVSKDWFGQFVYDTPKRIDFRISYPTEFPGMEIESLLWAEAKRGSQSNIIESFVQLILTIGKGRLHESELPPAYLGAFDAAKIAFVSYSAIMEVFDPKKDFNWNAPPSDHSSKEFIYLKETVAHIIDKEKFTFDFISDAEDLRKFIKKGFVSRNTSAQKILINKNNFVNVYFKWLKAVPPSINVNWTAAKKSGIIEADFYLADLLSANGKTLVENLYVVLDTDKYLLDRKIVDGMLESKQAGFLDSQRSYADFWNRYERPPKEEYWSYIQSRRDLLVPQDLREIQGSFFTPQIWVEKSQEYLNGVFGENWQEEYYVWDCCAGTGNLEVGLLIADNVWASTLEKGDVAIMRERVRNGANLYDNHIFQFDFLNDSFDKLPKDLLEIIKDPQRRQKLIVYINPPYKESSDAKQIVGTGKNKNKVATRTKVYDLSHKQIGTAARELFTQFLYRIYMDIPDCKVAHFSTLKHLQAPNFEKFNCFFRARLQKMFIVPADTFDNVQGQFPIGFFIWDTSVKETFTLAHADVYDDRGNPLGKKKIERRNRFMVEWLRRFYDRKNPLIGYLRLLGSDMQHNKDIFITLKPSANDFAYKLIHEITKNNLIHMAMYNAIRHCIEANWLNNREQFLFPNDGWEHDTEFQLDCLAFTLFDNSNNVKSADCINHWIPFTAQEVGSKNGFSSQFMTDFIKGKIAAEKEADLFDMAADQHVGYHAALQFSAASVAVFQAGREIWKYYHSQPSANPNASLYDIREFFQGRNEKERMNNSSDDKKYMVLIDGLRNNLKVLAKEIEAKVYEHGFLLR